MRKNDIISVSYTHLANGEATVSVTIALTKEAKESLDTVYPNGTYIEAYIQAEPLADAEGKIAAAHSIPVLAFYGDWESPSMFDHDTRSEVLSGEEKMASYFTGISGKATYCLLYTSFHLKFQRSWPT